MPKSPRYKIWIDRVESFTGRLIGFIDDKECKAILNIEDAARRVYSAAGMNKFEIVDKILTNKRFVIATDDLSKKGVREVFISPQIEYSVYLSHGRGFTCRDNNNYQFEEIL